MVHVLRVVPDVDDPGGSDVMSDRDPLFVVGDVFHFQRKKPVSFTSCLLLLLLRRVSQRAI